MNGIPVAKETRLLDATSSIPDYEEALIDAIRNQVTDSDRVVIVGGGRGVSSVEAANQAGSDGTVIAYEGQPDRVSQARQTVSLNDVDDIVEIHHGIVADLNIDINTGNAQMVPVDSIPPCDVLELDCEGTEIRILEDLSISPRVIIVETHACFGAPEDDVRALLDDRGYEVIECRTDDADHGIYVLTAVRRQN